MANSAGKPKPINGSYCKIAKISEQPKYAQGCFSGDSISRDSCFAFNHDEKLLSLQDVPEANSLGKLMRIVVDLSKQAESDFSPALVFYRAEKIPESFCIGFSFCAPEDDSGISDLKSAFPRLLLLLNELGDAWKAGKDIARTNFSQAVRKILRFVKRHSSISEGKGEFKLVCAIGKEAVTLCITTRDKAGGSTDTDDDLEINLPRTAERADDVYDEAVAETEDINIGTDHNYLNLFPDDDLDGPIAKLYHEMCQQWDEQLAANQKLRDWNYRTEMGIISDSSIDLADIQCEPIVPLYITATSKLPAKASLEQLMTQKVGLDIS